MQMVQMLVDCQPYVGSSNQSQYGMYQPYNPPPPLGYYVSNEHIRGSYEMLTV